MTKQVSNAINETIQKNQFKTLTELKNEIELIHGIKLSKDAISHRLRRKSNNTNYLNNNFVNDKIEFFQNGNEAELDVKTTSNPKTLNELLLTCNVDLNIWEVEKHVINKWEVGAKNQDTGKIETTPLFQVKIFLIRKVPIKQDIPIIQPINIKISSNAYNKLKKQNTTKLKKALIIPDSHNGYKRDYQTNKLIPFHDRDAWNLVTQIANLETFDRIILLGDMLDMAEWSDKFVKTPDFYWTTQPALIELAWWLKELVVSTKGNKFTTIDYLEGNHEARLPRMLTNNLICAYNLKTVNSNLPALSVENLLCLKEMGINYIGDYPNGEIWLNDNLCVSHGNVVRQGSGNTSKSVVQNARCSEIFGHIHRMEMSCITKFSKRGPTSYKVFSPGTIARIDGVVPSNSAKNNWQQGFSTVEYEEGNGLFEIIPITVNDGKCIYKGQLFESNFSLKNMKEEINRNEFNF